MKSESLPVSNSATTPRRCEVQIRHILLAEDNPNDVELTLSALDEQGLAQRVEVVNDGVEALDYLYCRGKFTGRNTGTPAVILLDLKMPRLTGMEVLQAIRADPALQLVPVVILTSSREEGDLIKGYKLGANAYVVKPVHFEDFMKAVRDLGMFWALLNEPPPNGKSPS